MLEDFGFGEKRLRGDEDGAEDGLGSGQFANSLDHSDLRLDIKKALEDYDEVGLSAAIDVARELGNEYPYKAELERAESTLMDMMGCPDGSFPKPDNDD